jgi:uncharacterized membrane protein
MDATKLRLPESAKVTWLRRYRLRQFLSTSFWFWPAVVVLLSVFIFMPAIDWLTEHGFRLGGLWDELTADRAKVILSNFSASMLTFLVFVLSSLLLVVTLASAQLTPRIMAITFADVQGRIMTCMLVLSFLLSIGVLARVEDDTVPVLGIKITVICVLVSIILFLRFVMHLGMSLRPISLMRHIADEGRIAIESIYPQVYETAKTERAARIPKKLLREDARVIPYAGRSGVLQAIGARALVEVARSAGCTIELEPQVGNSVVPGDPLFLVFPPDKPVDSGVLHQMVAVGPERTLEQDPVFAFRIIVDIACRALSPAVNDPTTAVLGIDQLERLLHFVGSRQLDPGMIYDEDRNLRLIIPVPKWEDYVSLAVSEIRLYGANSIQVPRRLRAMLEYLIESLPAPRAPALRKELQLLGKAVKREFVDAADLERVTTGDRQGVGGTTQVDS